MLPLSMDKPCILQGVHAHYSLERRISCEAECPRDKAPTQARLAPRQSRRMASRMKTSKSLAGARTAQTVSLWRATNMVSPYATPRMLQKQPCSSPMMSGMHSSKAPRMANSTRSCSASRERTLHSLSFYFMKKNIIYIIPGWGDTGKEKEWKFLSKSLQLKGYKVHRLNVEWKRGLSANIFKPEEDAIVIGFSYGAVIAYLIANKYTFKKVILCSLSPIESESYENTLKEHLKHMSKKEAILCTNDVKNIKIDLKNLKNEVILVSGELENIVSDVKIPENGHEMSEKYIKIVSNLV